MKAEYEWAVFASAEFCERPAVPKKHKKVVDAIEEALWGRGDQDESTDEMARDVYVAIKGFLK